MKNSTPSVVLDVSSYGPDDDVPDEEWDEFPELHVDLISDSSRL